ncbi:hypothetical protein [Burkholderia ambifaria]|uniref:hypothetical protein n=1 Tax=Burkholderia ambifaria TaxID=152480 RepID=UPI00158F613D|nr:hypothetical protein [Burkholderia ambifaria]
MAAKVGREEYRHLLNAHGRRVANRALVESLSREDRDWALFYDCYGREAALPENERCRTGMIHEFDPIGYSRFYDNHPCDKRSPMYHLTNGLSAQWFEWLASVRREWGEWVIRFIHLSMRLADRGESIEFFDRIARDEGEGEMEGDARFCFWYAGWRGWVAFSDNLTDDETAALRLTFQWLSGVPHRLPRHPEPGSPEAEMKYPPAPPKTDQEAA